MKRWASDQVNVERNQGHDTARQKIKLINPLLQNKFWSSVYHCTEQVNVNGCID